ncbi:hypothetical protein BJV78DRAFT_1157301 [Lactifluus subvellereus]|nr:hypothetical protein BJV78DRAFT_1157301 [Lactifluus subvellereus]
MASHALTSTTHPRSQSAGLISGTTVRTLQKPVLSRMTWTLVERLSFAVTSMRERRWRRVTPASSVPSGKSKRKRSVDDSIAYGDAPQLPVDSIKRRTCSGGRRVCHTAALKDNTMVANHVLEDYVKYQEIEQFEQPLQKTITVTMTVRKLANGVVVPIIRSSLVIAGY